MAKATGLRIEDLDYNTVRNDIVKVLGVGTGKFGYGQPIMSSPVSRGIPITAAQWNNLRADIYNARLHQDGVPPSLTQVAQGLAIDYTTATPAAQFIASTATATTNKFNVGAGQFVVQPGGNKSRTVPWSTKLASTVKVTFNTADQARWFFNSGGQIRFSSSRSGGSVINQTQNNAWTSLLNSVGTVTFSATSNLDFYELTNQYKNVYTSPPSATQTSDNLVCISVIDEASPTADVIRNDWLTFRSNYPNRPFYLLQPSGYTASALKVPSEYTADPKAYGPIAVTRDNGNALTASDWYVLCNLDQVPVGGKVALSIDNSGSMTTAQVSAAIALLESKCALRGISIIRLDMGTAERWASPFNASIIAANDFSANRYQINAKCNVANNSNGGATVIDFEVVWEDNYNNVNATGTDQVDGTLNLVVDELRAQGNLIPSGQFTITRPTYSVSDILEVGPIYAINASSASVDEGGTVIFNVTTANVADGSIAYWTARPITGSLVASDFVDNLMQGTVTISNNAASINRVLRLDSTTEGNESFEMILRTGSQSGPVVAKSQVVTVRDTSITPTYAISPSTTSVNESGSVTFNVVTTGVQPGTTLYWTTSLTTVTSSNDIVCIAVCDESSVGLSTNTADWVAFRNNYPNRPFYLLQPGGPSRGSLNVPAAFTSDSKAFGPITVNRDGGSSASASDWYALCNLDQVPSGSRIALSIDNSGSMTTATVQASINLLTSRLAARNISITNLTMSGERWAFAFNTNIAMPAIAAINNEDFTDNATTGSVIISSSGTGSFVRGIREDFLSEGAESFLISLRTGSINGPVVATSAAVTINDTSLTRTYAMSASTATVFEGNSVTFGVTTSNVPNGTPLYWTLLSTQSSTTADDFTDFLSSGTVIINANAGTIVRTLRANEGNATPNDKFRLQLRTGSITGPIVATSPEVEIIDVPEDLPPTYAVAPNVTGVNEGGSVVYTVTTTNVPNGTVLFWTVSGGINSSDFTDSLMSGTVTINGNTGSITRTITNDFTSEGTENFILYIRTNSTSGAIVATAATVTINDTSLTRTYTVSASTSVVTEGNSVTFFVTTSNVPTGTTLYWTTLSVQNSTNSADFTDNLMSGSFVVSNNSANIVRTLRAFEGNAVPNDQFRLQIRTDSTSGPIVALSPTVEILDNPEDLPKTYAIAPNVSSINEGGVVTFVVNTTNVTNGTVLYWTAAGSIIAADFTDNSLSGSVTINNNTGSISRIISTDARTEGTETFYLSLRTGGTTGNIVANSASVTINDTSLSPPTYAISRNMASANEGTTVTFTVNTTNVPNGTTLYWTTTGSPARYYPGGQTNPAWSSLLNTYSVWQGNGTYTWTAYFPVTTNYVISSSIDNYGSIFIDGTRVLDVPTFSAVYNATTSVTAGWHTITITAVDTGVVGSLAATIRQTSTSGPIIWTTRDAINAQEVVTVNGADFTDGVISGSVVINNDIGTILRTLRNDLTNEGPENFTVALRTTSTSGTIVATSGPVAVNDTSVNPDVTCISVIDEASPTASTIASDWAAFRNNWPNRRFYLLRPSSSFFGNDLKVPASFYSDPRAFGIINVNRDNGNTGSISDWFALCNLATLPAGSKVAVAIDNSGSMTTASVQASYNYFMSRCASAGLTVITRTMSGERWALPFNTTL